MAASAAEVSLQLRPAILPLSSMRKIVSNSLKNAYGESSQTCIDEAKSAGLFGAAEYGGGAPMFSTGFGLRVGTVVANGLVGSFILPIGD